MKNGQTAHSTFNIPIDLHPEAECCFESDSEFAKRLNNVRLIIWDEIVMMHVQAVEAVDLLLQCASGIDQPFGGKVVVFSGDFCQILCQP
jgi:hypothetical protein